MFSGPDTIGDARRHELTSVRRLGPDARLDYDVVRLMFTGIVEELGRVVSVTANDGGARIVIDARRGARRCRARCVDRRQRLLLLTAVARDERSWAADAVIETLAGPHESR